MPEYKSPLFPETLHSLEERLSGPKPGLKAQLRMTPNPRPGDQVYYEVEDSSLKAGVLVLFYPREDRLHLVLTRRTDKVDFHKGQISFPGGRLEAGEGLEEAALREAQEELDVDPDSIRILGMLTPLYIPPSNYCIYPVVALTESRPDFQPSKIEVAEVLEIPLDHLLNPQNVRREIWNIRDADVEVPFYEFCEHKIWGATAMVMAELLEMIKGLSSR
jgi:8-oxo-dGTP pyrophosphatase MutT (NUDIX family)